MFFICCPPNQPIVQNNEYLRIISTTKRYSIINQTHTHSHLYFVSHVNPPL